MMTQEMLKLRSQIKKKKPVFTRQDSHKKSRLSNKPRWRKPRGSDSKMRVGKKGYRRSVQPGWGSPRSVKGMNRLGLKDVLVSSLSQLEKIDKKAECGVISSKVGTKKRLALMKKAQELKIIISNFKDIAAYVSKHEEKFKERQSCKKDKEAKKDEKEKKLKQKADDKSKEKKDIESTLSDEEKKIEQKKEFDKLVTSKDSAN